MKRKGFACTLMLTLSLSAAVLTCGQEQESVPLRLEEALEAGAASVTSITPTVDGQEVHVDWYAAPYLQYPNLPEDQKVNIYIPENADEASPIILYVNNAGWQADTYPTDTIEDGADYDGTNDKVGVALKEGYVVVSYGCRSRANDPVNGIYLGHSPATMTDTKAVVRYLRLNQDFLSAGDAEKIVITGTSGGGALSAVVAASGNSPDYYPYLYEVGAAGIDSGEDGTFVSTIGDDVFAVIGYCPIIDLGHTSSSYEWMMNATRRALAEDGEPWPENYSFTEEELFAASDAVASVFPEYFDGLGLTDEDGNPVTTENLKAVITALMEEEIGGTLEEIGAEQMEQDVEKDGARENNGWIVFQEDGTFSYDLDKHLYYVAKYTPLKTPIDTGAQSILYSKALFGKPEEEYSPFSKFHWERDEIENNVGMDDTGLTWEEYLQTEDGQELLQQIKMSNALAYLLENDDQADTAPNWYIRHGMDDRDASFVIETALYCAALHNEDIQDLNFSFAWLKPHSGDYDVAEAYAWLKGIL